MVPAPSPLSFTIRNPINGIEGVVPGALVRIFAIPGVDKLVSYLYFNGTASGSVSFPDLPAGEYFAALYTNDSYTEVSNRVPFTVTP